MVPGEQGIATKESDMSQQKLAFKEKASGNDEELAKLRQLKGLLKSLS